MSCLKDFNNLWNKVIQHKKVKAYYDIRLTTVKTIELNEDSFVNCGGSIP